MAVEGGAGGGRADVRRREGERKRRREKGRTEIERDPEREGLRKEIRIEGEVLEEIGLGGKQDKWSEKSMQSLQKPQWHFSES